MSNITVRYEPSIHPLNVVVDGLCNHAEAYHDTIREQFFNGMDYTDQDVSVVVCPCGAYKLSDELGWREA